MMERHLGLSDGWKRKPSRKWPHLWRRSLQHRKGSKQNNPFSASIECSRASLRKHQGPAKQIQVGQKGERGNAASRIHQGSRPSRAAHEDSQKYTTQKGRHILTAVFCRLHLVHLVSSWPDTATVAAAPAPLAAPVSPRAARRDPAIKCSRQTAAGVLTRLGTCPTITRRVTPAAADHGLMGRRNPWP